MSWEEYVGLSVPGGLAQGTRDGNLPPSSLSKKCIDSNNQEERSVCVCRGMHGAQFRDCHASKETILFLSAFFLDLIHICLVRWPHPPSSVLGVGREREVGASHLLAAGEVGRRTRQTSSCSSRRKESLCHSQHPVSINPRGRLLLA